MKARHHILITLLALLALTPPSFARQDAAQEQTALELPPFNVSLYRNGRVEGQVTIILVLEAKSESGLSEVRAHLPQLQADFFRGLTDLSRLYFDVNEPIQPEIVSRYLAQFAAKRLGQDKVAIYIKRASITPT